MPIAPTSTNPSEGPESPTDLIKPVRAPYEPMSDPYAAMQELSQVIPKPTESPIQPQRAIERSFWGDSVLGTLGDVALAPVRGTYNAAADFYSFVDNIGGDFLPDISQWESNTGVGDLLSSGFQLAAGMYTGGAILKGVGIAGALSKLGKAGKFSNFVAANFLGDTLMYHTDTNIARMLKDASLGSPLTNWLATNQDDPEIEKRLKGAVDGLAMNFIAEPVIAGLRAYRQGVRDRRLLSGLLSGDAGKIAESAEALNKATKDIHEKIKGQSSVLSGGGSYGVKQTKDTDLADAALGGVGINGPAMRAFINDGKKSVQPHATIYDTLRAEGTPFDRAVRVIRAGRRDVLNPQAGPSAAAGVRAYESVVRDAATETIRQGGKLDTEVISRAYGNLKDWLQLSKGQEATWLTRMDLQMAAGAEPTVELAARVISSEALMQQVSGDLRNALKQLGTPELAMNPVELARLVQRVEKAGAYTREFLGLSPTQSRSLRDIPEEVAGLRFGGEVTEHTLNSEVSSVSLPKFSGARKSPKEAIAYINAKGGEQKILGILTAHKEAFAKHEMGAIINTAVHHESRAWDMVAEWWINGILSHGQTQLVNTVANLVTAYYRPLETIVGGAVHAGMGAASFNKAIMSEGYQGMKHGLRTLSELSMSFLDTFGLFGGRHGGETTRRALIEAYHTGDSTLLKSAKDAGKIEIGPAITAKTLGDTVGSVPIIGPLANQMAGLTDRTILHGLGSAAVDGAGQVIRLPQRLLSAVDQLYKQINFRAKARSLLLDEAEAAGIPSIMKSEYVASRMNNILREGQALTVERMAGDAISSLSAQRPSWALGQAPVNRARVLNQEIERNFNKGNFDISQKALGYTKEVTFTDDADKLTQVLKSAVVHFPPLRLVMPFITTPVNLLKFAYNRTLDPMLGLPSAAVEWAGGLVKNIGKDVTLAGGAAGQKSWFKFTRDILSEDPIKQADALGRLSFATGFVTTASILASNSMNQDATVMIHGKGPHDPNERKLWINSGRLPYSVQFGKTGEEGTKSFQFNRLDPFGMIFGAIADAVTYSHFATPEEQKQLGATTGAILSAIGNNIVNKTYLQGLSDFLDILRGDDPANMASIVQNFGASMMIPNALNSPALGGAEEDTLREVHNFYEAKLNRTPWGSDKLTPQRNPLGEPVKRIPQWGEDAAGRWVAFWSPIKVQKDKNDPVLSEMVRLGHPFKATEDTFTLGGVDVDLRSYKNAKGQTAADRYAELVGEPVGNGNSLRKTLTYLVGSQRYKDLPEFKGDDTINDPKVLAIGKYFSAYRGVARNKLLHEFPEIPAFVQSQIQKQRQAYFPGAK